MKYDIGPEAKNWPSILGAPNLTSLGRVITYIFQIKKSYRQNGPASRCKGGHSRLGYYFWDKGLKDYVAMDLGVYHDLLLFDQCILYR